MSGGGVQGLCRSRALITGLGLMLVLLHPAARAQQSTAEGGRVTSAAKAAKAEGATGTALRLVVLAPADDPRLERSRIERAVPGHPGGPAADAVQLALQDAQRSLQQAQIRLDLQVLDVVDAAAARAAVAGLSVGSTVAVISDLPAAWTLAAATATPLPVINIGAADDELREGQCRTNLWHATPSERMRADALAQALVARKWTKVLLLTRQDPPESPRVTTVQAALKRYGLKLVDTRPFKLSADPRERDLANTRLLTQGDYDVVWVVDADGEFAVTLPFRTVLPRPVVGDGGLVAVAWSSKFERFGAPQVSRRLARRTGRMMGAHDWVAWMAGKTAVELALAAPKTDAAAVATRAQAWSRLELDGSKGVAMDYRPWDGQLRMPMLLSDGQAVIEMAPGDGVLHPRNRLDTLGADGPEKRCKARAG